MREGWQVRTLGDLCEYRRGLTYSKADEVASSENVVLRAMNIDLSSHALDLSELRYIADHVVVPEGKLVRKGSLLICTASGSKSHLGKIAYIDDDYGYAFGGFMGMLTPGPEVEPRYLFHLMASRQYEDFIGSLTDGININNLKFSDLASFLVRYPPLEEQRRIVAILDEAFADIAVAKANAEENLENAQATFESFLQSIFSRRDDGWDLGRLDSRVESISTGPFGSLLHKSDYEIGGIPLVNPINILGSTIVPDDNKAVGETKAAELANYALREDDIVIGRRGEIGRCAVVTRDQSGWLCGTGCFVIRPSERADSRFLAHLLRSPTYRGRLERLAGRATMPNISNVDLASLVVALPGLHEQRAIAARIDEVSNERRALASRYQRKLAALDELKQSLLHQAFSGELTAGAA